MTSLANSAGAETEIVLDGAEHILIEDELANESALPRTLVHRKMIRNHARGTQTEIALYAEGLLRLRVGTNKRVLKDHLIELDYLDPEFEQQRTLARGWLWGSILFAVLTALIWIVFPLTALQPFMLVGVGMSLLATAAALRGFFRYSEVTRVFYTPTGRAEVFRLTANFGCLGKFRRAARDISAAVRRTGLADRSSDTRFLRKEMQAHYRLLEKGVIGRAACSDGTARILARFG